MKASPKKIKVMAFNITANGFLPTVLYICTNKTERISFKKGYVIWLAKQSKRRPACSILVTIAA